jgi:hypothetical protein
MRGRDGERPMLAQAALDFLGERRDLLLKLITSGTLNSREVEVHRETVVAEVGFLRAVPPLKTSAAARASRS